MWKDYGQVIPCFCQLCPSVYLPVTSQEGSAHGDTVAPLLSTPAAEAQEEMTTLHPFSTLPTPALSFHTLSADRTQLQANICNTAWQTAGRRFHLSQTTQAQHLPESRKPLSADIP